MLGRKPDIKLRLKEADIAALQELQRRFLCNAFRYLRPGGRLLYSTCTLTAEEDEDNARWLLDRFPELTPLDFSAELPEIRAAEACRSGAVKLLPSRLPLDGFFISVFRKAE